MMTPAHHARLFGLLLLLAIGVTCFGFVLMVGQYVWQHWLVLSSMTAGQMLFFGGTGAMVLVTVIGKLAELSIEKARPNDDRTGESRGDATS